MSKNVKTKAKASEPEYIIYNPKNGRILGIYSRYDAEKGIRVRCELKDVIKAIDGASPEIKASEGLEILERMTQNNIELKDFKVDPKEKSLIRRKHLRSQTKKWPPE